MFHVPLEAAGGPSGLRSEGSVGGAIRPLSKDAVLLGEVVGGSSGRHPDIRPGVGWPSFHGGPLAILTPLEDFVAVGTPPFLPGAAWPGSHGQVFTVGHWQSSGHEKICRGQCPNIRAGAWLAKLAWWAIGNSSDHVGIVSHRHPDILAGSRGQALMVNIPTESLSAHLKIWTERLSPV